MDERGSDARPPGDVRSDAVMPVGDVGSALLDYAVFTVDVDGTVASWNRGAELIFGHRAEEVVGRPEEVLYPAEVRARNRPAEIRAEAAQLGTTVAEGWRLRRDGACFRAHTITAALRSTDGALRGFATIGRDETLAYIRLERSERNFHELFDVNPLGIGVFDRFGTVLEANVALCRLLGRRPDELTGAHVRDLVHPEDPRRDGLAAALDAGSPPDRAPVQEWSLRHADGRRLSCQLHIARSTQRNGDPIWLVVTEDITAQHRHAEELRYRATHDVLTGLPNLAGIEDLLDETDLTRAAVLYCDLDGFTRINASLGHDAGDELLVAVARRLRAELPVGWALGRPAGDEFVVVCPDAEAAGGAERVAELVSGCLHTTIPLRGQLIQIGAAVGVAHSGEPGTTGLDLVRFASAAADRAGRGAGQRIAVAGPAMIESINRQVRLEGQLREAIETDALVLHYQPVVAVDGTVLTAEALVRWPHPDLGMLAPGVFLPVAEQGGLLAALDRWVLRTALREAAEWPVVAGAAPSVSVNLAALIPGDPDFVELITEELRSSGIDWRRVIVELVETVLIDLPDQARATMRSLADQGLRFAVDDFGTGYSSLARLRDYPPQILKIDRQFVAEIADRPADRVLVRGMVEMSHALGCRSTAEGVETAEQFAVLREIGVDAFQGWLFAKALPAAEFRALLGSGPLPDPARG